MHRLGTSMPRPWRTAVSERQVRGVVECRRATPHGHARRRRAAHPSEAQPRDHRLARARLPPPRAPRARHHSAQAAPRQRRPSRPLPRRRRAQGGVPHLREAHARRSDATVSVEGVRYQVPKPWRHLASSACASRAGTSRVDLVDARSGERLSARQAPQCPGAAPTHRTFGRRRWRGQAPLPSHRDRRPCSSASSTTKPPPDCRRSGCPIANAPAPHTDDEHGER